MDLGLFLAVLWRSRRLMLAGVLLAVVLAVLSYGTPGFSGGKPALEPRGAEVWQSESQLLIAQAGFPYREPPEATEPARNLGSLSPIYANLANGGLVQSEIRQQLGPLGTVKASEDIDLAASSFLPFVNIVATASTPAKATRLAAGAASIFQAFVARQQALNNIPPSRRIQLSVVDPGDRATLSEGHKLSIPVLVFVAVLIGVMSFVLLRENVRPRVAAATGRLASELPPELPLQPLSEPHAGTEPRARHGHASSIGAHDGEGVVHRDPAVRAHVRQ